MANEIEINQKNIEENTEIATLFERIEYYLKKRPDVVAVFFKKFESMYYDNFDWAYALFHSDDKPAGFLDKFLPYINAVLLIVLLVAFFIKK